jgi:hypothetical protein
VTLSHGPGPEPVDGIGPDPGSLIILNQETRL